jgi:non-ribosomal peptide synthetase component F
VVRELGIEVNGANPVYQSMIVLEPALAAPDPEWSAHMMENEITRAVDATKLDLELQIDERPDGHLAGRLIYDRDLFKAETAERLAERWSRILAAVAADPTLTVSRLVAVSSDEERRQLVEWNATASERSGASVPDLLRARCAAQPEAPAVSCGRETITYGELDSRSDSVAADLRAGAVIALDEEPSVRLVVSALGTLKAGDASPAAVLFTRTGKAVAITHRAAVNAATALVDETGLSSTDRVVVLPEGCIASPVTELWAPLMAGAEVILASREESVDGAKLSRLIKRRKATFMHASPETWQTLIDSKLRAARSLRAVSSGGPLPQALADQILVRFRVLWNAYGTPETAGIAAIGPLEPPAAVAVGHPIANTRVYIVDPAGRPVPVGAVGDLLVAGVGVATEYLNRPELAGDLAATSPDGTRAFRTGDRARWLPDGILQIA